MEPLLRKHLWLLDLLALAATAVVAAHATAHVAAGVLLRLSLAGPAIVERASPSPDVVVPAPDRRDETIVRRNIFCSACGSSAPRGRPDQPAPSRALPLHLVAIMYAPASAGPRLSVAIIKDQRGASGGYVVGAAVDCPAGLATIEAIDELGVALRLSDGQRQYLTLLGETHGAWRKSLRRTAGDRRASNRTSATASRAEFVCGTSRRTASSPGSACVTVT